METRREGWVLLGRPRIAVSDWADCFLDVLQGDTVNTRDWLVEYWEYGGIRMVDYPTERVSFSGGPLHGKTRMVSTDCRGYRDATLPDMPHYRRDSEVTSRFIFTSSFKQK